MTRSSKLLSQLGNPRGVTGRSILQLLNRVNSNMNDQALAALDLRHNDHVLEIGFGGGSLIARILDNDRTTRVSGVEISKLATKNARKIFRDEPRVAIEYYEGDTLPYGDHAFSRAAAVHVIYFWTDFLYMFSEIHRVLAIGGKFVLCYSDQSPDEVTRFPRKAVEAQLQLVGFETVRTTEVLDKDNDIQFCTAAVKTSNIDE